MSPEIGLLSVIAVYYIIESLRSKDDEGTVIAEILACTGLVCEAVSRLNTMLVSWSVSILPVFRFGDSDTKLAGKALKTRGRTFSSIERDSPRSGDGRARRIAHQTHQHLHHCSIDVGGCARFWSTLQPRQTTFARAMLCDAVSSCRTLWRHIYDASGMILALVLHTIRALLVK